MSAVLATALLLVLMGAAVTLAGGALERAAFGRAPLGALRPLARWVLGFAVWTAALFALAAVGALCAAGLAAAAILLAALAAAARWKLAAPSDPATRGLRARDAFPLALLALLVAPLFAGALHPAVSWDAATYHLTLPRLYLEHGGFRPVPMNVYARWPQGVELLFAAAMLVRDYVLAKVVQFGFGLLVLYALYAACRERGSPGSAWLAMLLFLGNGAVVFELQVAYVDVAQAFYFLAAFLFLLRALTGGRARDPALWIAGAAAGLAAGTKVSGVAAAALLGALYLAAALTRPGAARRDELAAAALRYALPVLLLWAPWLVKTWLETGNPVYPFLHAWWGGPDWDATLTEQFVRWQRSIGMGRGPVDYALLPLRVILYGGEGYDRFYGSVGRHWIAVLPLTLVFGLGDRTVRRCLATALAYFAYWAATSQQARFLLPILPLLALAASLAFSRAVGRLAPARTRSALHWGAIALAALALAWDGRDRALRAVSVLAYYAAADGAPGDAGAPPALAFVNRALPPDARLLFLNTNQGFFCERDYLADSFFEASQIAAWLGPAEDVPALRARLRERGITHLLVERRDWGIAYPPALAALLSDPEQVELLYHSPDGRTAVLALRPEPAGVL